jgi:hypothetical protein
MIDLEYKILAAMQREWEFPGTISERATGSRTKTTSQRVAATLRRLAKAGKVWPSAGNSKWNQKFRAAPNAAERSALARARAAWNEDDTPLSREEWAERNLEDYILEGIPLECAVLLSGSFDGADPVVKSWPLNHFVGDNFASSTLAVFRAFRDASDDTRRLRLMVELWHSAAFRGESIAKLHEAALRIPEYRDLLADDCLPARYAHERYGE